MGAPEPAGKEEQGAAEATTELEALADDLRVLGSARRLELLSFLTEPHSIDEVAEHLGTARQTAHEHLGKLVDVGVVRRLRGAGGGSGLTFVLEPSRLFSIQEAFGELGRLRPELAEAAALHARTETAQQPETGDDSDLVPRVTVVRGLRPGSSVRLEGSGPWLMGRERDAAVCLDHDAAVSVRHAELRRTDDAFEIADLYSSNGTYVEWQRLERGGTRALEQGDLIQLGRTILTFRRPR